MLPRSAKYPQLFSETPSTSSERMIDIEQNEPLSQVSSASDGKKPGYIFLSQSIHKKLAPAEREWAIL
jgi:hypothetical protein